MGRELATAALHAGPCAQQKLQCWEGEHPTTTFRPHKLLVSLHVSTEHQTEPRYPNISTGAHTLDVLPHLVGNDRLLVQAIILQSPSKHRQAGSEPTGRKEELHESTSPPCCVSGALDRPE